MREAESIPYGARPAAKEKALPARMPRLSGSIGRSALYAMVLVYLGVILIGPIAALLVHSLKLGPAQLLRSLAAPGAVAALKTSTILVLIAVAVNAILGTFGAIVITRHRFVGRGLFSALVDLPLAISPVMIGLAFMLLLGREGWLTPVLDLIGVKALFSFPGLVIATLFVTLPYTIREVAYLLGELGTSEEEAASTLGARSHQIFFRVTLPNMRPALAHGLVMTAARGFGEFGAVLILGGSIAGKTQTATTFIHDAIEERDLASAYAMALALAFISVGFLAGLELMKRLQEPSREQEPSK